MEISNNENTQESNTQDEETDNRLLNKDQYIGSYFDFQKYLIDPEFRKKYSYLTKELGIANLNPFEIFMIGWEMEIVSFLKLLKADETADLFLNDIYTMALLSRSKGGFGAKLLVSQITKGEYEVKNMGDEAKKRFLNFGRNQKDSDQDHNKGGFQ